MKTYCRYSEIKIESNQQEKIYSCHYPIILQLTPDQIDLNEEIIEDVNARYAAYTIYLNNKKLHEGRVYSPYPTDDQIEDDEEKEKNKHIYLDIAPICRESLQVLYEKKADQDEDEQDEDNKEKTEKQAVHLTEVYHNEEVTTIGRFQVRKADGTTLIKQYTVIYNYNTDYISEYPRAAILNNPLLMEADPRQLLTLSAYNLDGQNKYFYYIDGKQIQEPATLQSQVFQLYTLDLNIIKPLPGQKITITCNEQPNFQQEENPCFTYTIISPCRNRYVLYYINKNGGIDSLLCSGKHINSFQASNTSINLYKDCADNDITRSDKLYAHNRKISQQINKKYQLNTSILQDESASHIDELIFSPKVWIHDLDNDTITSCNINETNYTIKNFHNDKIVTYQINVTESQEYLRK